MPRITSTADSASATSGPLSATITAVINGSATNETSIITESKA